MNQPDWTVLEKAVDDMEAAHEAQRMKAERRLARIEAAMGTACVVVWIVVIVDAVSGLVR